MQFVADPLELCLSHRHEFIEYAAEDLQVLPRLYRQIPIFYI